MKRYKALLKETWWLWIGLLVFGCVLGVTLSPVFFVAFPICFFSFIYFGLMRYDKNGNPTGDRA